MVSLRKRHQILAKIEDVEGTSEQPGMSVSDLVEVIAGANFGYEIATIERDLARNTLTKPEAQAGLRSANYTADLELAGPATWTISTGVVTTPPNFDLFLRACGFGRRVIMRFLIDAGWAGGTKIAHGTVVTFGSSGATFRVWSDTFDNDTHVYLEHLTGTPTGSDLTFTDGTSTVTLDTTGIVYNSGWVYYMADDSTTALAYSGGTANGPAVGDQILGDTSGARGYVVRLAVGSGDATGTMYVRKLTGSGTFTDNEGLTIVGGNWTGTPVVDGTTPTQFDVPSLTILSYDDGIRSDLVGGRGNATLTLTNGERGRITCNMQGTLSTIADATNLTGITAKSLVPPRVTGGYFELREKDSVDPGYLPCFNTLALESRNTVTLRECPQHASGSGYESAVITDRNPGGNFDPETVLNAVFPIYTNALNKTSFLLRATVGTLADPAGLGTGGTGNAFEIRADHTQIENPTNADREELRVTEMPLLFRGTEQDELFIFEV